MNRGEYMKTNTEKELNDVEKIKNFLMKMGFVCKSYPTAQNLVYSKDGETIIIRNNGK
jgi:hypothetical protein